MLSVYERATTIDCLLKREHYRLTCSFVRSKEMNGVLAFHLVPFVLLLFFYLMSYECIATFTLQERRMALFATPMPGSHCDSLTGG